MPYALHDIVLLRREHGSKVYAIVELPSGPGEDRYVAVKLDKGPFVKRYWVHEEEIAAKIGVLDPKALELGAEVFKLSPPENWRLGQAFARHMAEQSLLESDRQAWAFLARCQPGDFITIRQHTRHGIQLVPHRFLEVLPEGQKYVFRAINPNGTIYRFPLDALHPGSALPPKRTEGGSTEGSG